MISLGPVAMHWSDVHHSYGFEPDPDTPDPRYSDPDKTPETPPDEPRPPRIQDPPPPNEHKGPYTVHMQGWSRERDGGTTGEYRA